MGDASLHGVSAAPITCTRLAMTRFAYFGKQIVPIADANPPPLTPPRGASMGTPPLAGSAWAVHLQWRWARSASTPMTATLLEQLQAVAIGQQNIKHRQPNGLAFQHRACLSHG